MKGRGAIPAALALLLAPAMAAAAPAAAAPADKDLSGVTVTAPGKPDPLVSPPSQFVREHLPESPFSEQYPRFHDPICVKVQGLPPEFGGFIEKRILDLATEVHAPVAKPAGCTVNVHVIFSDRPQAQLDDIAKRRDILIGYQFRPQLLRLSKFTHPVEARYVTRSVGDNGDSALDIFDPDRYDPAMGKVPPHGRAGSRLGNGMSAEIVHSLILADANKMAGEKIEVIADYVAVLALARWQGLERCNSIPTILNRLAPDCDRESAPEAATPEDIALLTGLYAVGARETGSQQRMSIADRVARAHAAQGTAH